MGAQGVSADTLSALSGFVVRIPSWGSHPKLPKERTDIVFSLRLSAVRNFPIEASRKCASAGPNLGHVSGRLSAYAPAAQGLGRVKSAGVSLVYRSAAFLFCGMSESIGEGR
jgi:hypothetical protein